MITLPLPRKPKLIVKKGNKATFEIEGLYPGYGATIGNSIRRVLLSSLPGAAVTQCKIKGVHHGFSTIPGVFEDVMIITLNLKQLCFKLHSQEPQKAILKIKGEKEVRGKDFKLPSQLELINKNLYIATLTEKKAELDIEILVEMGIGYVPVEERKKEKLEIGVIALDAIFSPIKKVGFEVENMRVEKRTDFNRLKLTIETDGTISPEQAFYQALETLIKHFSLFAQEFKKEVSKE